MLYVEKIDDSVVYRVTPPTKHVISSDGSILRDTSGSVTDRVTSGDLGCVIREPLNIEKIKPFLLKVTLAREQTSSAVVIKSRLATKKYTQDQFTQDFEDFFLELDNECKNAWKAKRSSLANEIAEL